MRLLTNSLIYVGGAAVSRLFALLALPLLTAKLSPSEYGMIGMLLMVGAFVSAVLGMGLGTSIGELYFSRKEQEFRNRVVTSGWYVVLVLHVFGGFFLWGASEQISRFLFGDSAYSEVTAYMLIAQLIQHVIFPLHIKMQFEERARRAVFAMVLSVFLTTVLTLWWVVVLDGGVRGYAEALVYGAAVQLMIYMVLARPVWQRSDRQVAMELIRSGWPMVFSFLILFVIQQGARLPLAWFAGMGDVGLFQVGVSLAAPFGMLTSAFISAWTPHALNYADRHEQAITHLARITRLYVAGMGVLVLVGFMLAPWIVHVLTAQAFQEAWLVVGPVILWHFYLSVFQMLLPPVYFAGEVARSVVRTQSMAAVFFVMVSGPLIQWMSLAGAGLVMALTGGVLILAQMYWNRRWRAGTYLQIAYPRSVYIMLILVGLAGGLIMTLQACLDGIILIVGEVAVLVGILGYSLWSIGSQYQWRCGMAMLGAKR